MNAAELAATLSQLFTPPRLQQEAAEGGAHRTREQLDATSIRPGITEGDNTVDRTEIETETTAGSPGRGLGTTVDLLV